MKLIKVVGWNRSRCWSVSVLLVLSVGLAACLRQYAPEQRTSMRRLFFNSISTGIVRSPCSLPLNFPSPSVSIGCSKRMTHSSRTTTSYTTTQQGKERDTAACATTATTTTQSRKGESKGKSLLRTGNKFVTFIRHGQTEMNEFLTKNPYRSSGFRDPGYYDTVLTATGISQARRLNSEFKRRNMKDEIELIMISPLTRTLQTAHYVFFEDDEDFERIPKLVIPHIREKLWLSSDVGSNPSRLARTFTGFNFDHLSDFWWYQGPNQHRIPPESWQIVHEEPDHEFMERLEKFREILSSRPEKHIAVVAHWGVIYAMTGIDFRNCEARTLQLSELRDKFRF
mmetsp:Transcript_24496/g.39494  ORF Transcript_24496/g.39494 Transcript_24496/m.39494 type:complete len:340 (-) Transcript_24496:200-1219(-)